MEEKTGPHSLARQELANHADGYRKEGPLFGLVRVRMTYRELVPEDKADERDSNSCRVGSDYLLSFLGNEPTIGNKLLCKPAHHLKRQSDHNV